MGILAEGGAVMPALGILYIAALMRKEGFPVEILDAEGSRSGISETVNSIVKQNPDVLGITATTLSILSAVKIAEEVKSRLPDIKVFIGGPHVTAMPMETIHDYPDVDGCVIGAGEAGFMKILSNNFIKTFGHKIVNIHPSLLPKYKGLNTHKRVLKNKEIYSGCTVHYVTSKLDSGKTILQKKVLIEKNETEKSLQKKILIQEHKLYPRSIISIFK